MSNVSLNRLGSLPRELEARGLLRLGDRTITPRQPRVLRATIDHDAPLWFAETRNPVDERAPIPKERDRDRRV
jgi:hypothetical protein